MKIRQPIITVLGHVDAGKTSLLDKIRKTTVVSKEAGGITQAIGTTEIPMGIIEKLSGDIIRKFKFGLEIPGLLFIDTPGHEAFNTLRKRGGSISDLAILVVDINDGLMPQTIESIDILKKSKTPFVVVINKIDVIRGWVSKSESFLENYENQQEDVKTEFEEKFYKIIEQMSYHDFNCDRFDRVRDFSKTIATVPLSASTGEGIPELLAILSGLSQQFLKDRLIVSGEGKGNIIEIKKIQGLGTTIDVIIYDGSIKKSDYLVIGGNRPRITKIKAMMQPDPMRDIRTEKKFNNVNEINAASSVKISAPGIDDLVSGLPIMSAKTIESAKKLFDKMEKMDDIEISTEKEGLILRADTVGSLEALIHVFKNHSIKEALVGNVNRESVIKAEANKNFKNKIIISFNSNTLVDVKEFAKDKDVKIFSSKIIYKLVEDYEEWIIKKEEGIKKEKMEGITLAGKIRIIPGLVFRASSPAIVGCEVLGGKLKSGYFLMKDNETIGEIKQLQADGKPVQEAKEGDKVAVSIDGANIGRQLKEGDILYTDVKEKDFKNIEETGNNDITMNEILEIRRKKNPYWGV